jgi:hypothetical protein
MPSKSDYIVGLEAVLNNPQTSFLKNPKVFSEVHKESGMSISAMMKHIGKGKKASGNKRNEPTDEEKSAERLKQMESSTK